MPQINAPKAQVEPPTQAQDDEASTSEELEDDEFENDDDDDEEIAPFVNSVFDAPVDPLADDSSQGSNQG